jgi:tellurite resistance protein TerC
MNWIIWLCFFAIFIGVLALDLGVLHREARTMHVRQALGWTVVWVIVALSFSGLVYGVYEHHWFGWRGVSQDAPDGAEAAIQFITGYLLEWSLSVDNIFVIAIIFTFMKIPAQFQYRVLFWGIVGAIVLRGAMIAMGAALIHAFDWMFYVFGAILLLSALRMLKDDPAEGDLSNNASVRLVRRFVAVTPELHGSRFFVRQQGKLIATPLFVALNIVNITDVVYAVDSIPAIIAVTRDPFLVFTSNAFAILGLRSLYFAVVGLMQMFRYIKYSLVFILAFVGFKMIFMNHFHVPNLVSLGIIVVALLVGVLVSMLRSKTTDIEATKGSDAR